LAIWVGVNLLFLILQFLKLEILLLICTSFGGAYTVWLQDQIFETILRMILIIGNEIVFIALEAIM
jgi:hypothetical protein